MDPHGSSGGNRAEAERWLLIAEKLLAGRDLVGSKTFAIRARDSEPTRLEAADQILAVADTLIAGEKRINEQHLDWYSVLQLPRHTVDPELIATHYRRLAILLNPHRNPLPFADQAMKLVSDAWSVLSNPDRKTLYDNVIVLFSKLDNPSNENQNRQQDDAVRRSSRNSNDSAKSNATNVSEEIEDPDDSDDVNSNFWTACPYCYNMYEYPGVYVNCSLRCQNCRRAFHGTKIMAPPPIIEGKETYFCCWGFYPLVVSMSKLDKNKGGGATSWSPFSPMFSGPQFGEDRRNNGAGDNANVGARQNNANDGKSSAPRIYVDDDEVYVEVSESEEESDDEWDSNNRQKKKAKNTRSKDLIGNKDLNKTVGEMAKNLKGVSGDGLQGGSLMPEVMGAPNVSNADNSRKVAGNNAKKQTGKFAKQWGGRLDLNVEFSNDVEEPAPGMSRVNALGMGRGNALGMGRGSALGMGRGNNLGMSRGNGAGNGEEEGMEGIAFFEGLDEILEQFAHT